MTEKNYTHKIVMFDVNSSKRVAYFESGEWAKTFETWAVMLNTKFVADNTGTRFNMNNIVQMNPVEVSEK